MDEDNMSIQLNIDLPNGLPVNEMDALPLEYKLQKGSARRDLGIPNIVNNTVGTGISCVFGLGFSEKILHDLGVQCGTFPDD